MVQTWLHYQTGSKLSGTSQSQDTALLICFHQVAALHEAKAEEALSKNINNMMLAPMLFWNNNKKRISKDKDTYQDQIVRQNIF